MILIINNTPKELESFKDMGLSTMCIDVREIPKKIDGDIYFVSVANSLLFMEGGIDLAYLQMFGKDSDIRTLQYYIQNIMKKEKDVPVSLLGRKYLPVGAAMCNEIPHTNKKYFLVSAPTMLLPQNVKSTKNAYYAMKAVLKVWNREGTLVVPLLACGIGKMDLNDAAIQIKKAIDENHEYERNLYVPKNYINILNEQPKIYENTEFFEIDINKIKNT